MSLPAHGPYLSRNILQVLETHGASFYAEFDGIRTLFSISGRKGTHRPSSPPRSRPRRRRRRRWCPPGCRTCTMVIRSCRPAMCPLVQMATRYDAFGIFGATLPLQNGVFHSSSQNANISKHIICLAPGAGLNVGGRGLLDHGVLCHAVRGGHDSRVRAIRYDRDARLAGVILRASFPSPVLL